MNLRVTTAGPRVRSRERLNGSSSSRSTMSSIACETESTSSSHCASTELVTIAISPATSATPVRSASAGAGRSRRRRRSRPATGVRAGAIVSAIMIGRTITRRYQRSARIVSATEAQTSNRHDHAAARSRFAGTGGRITGRSCRWPRRHAKSGGTGSAAAESERAAVGGYSGGAASTAAGCSGTTAIAAPETVGLTISLPHAPLLIAAADSAAPYRSAKPCRQLG